MKGVLAEFFDYMKYHFDDEEAFMKSIGYPDLEEHARIHKSIIDSMITLITEISNVNEMKEQLLVIAKKWLLEHILQEDMQIGVFLRKEAYLKKKGLKSSVQENDQNDEDAMSEVDKPIFSYTCSCEGRIHTISQEIHQKILAGAKFRCKKCGEVIQFYKEN